MKQGKRPTVAQRKYIQSFRLNDKEKKLPRRER